MLGTKKSNKKSSTLKTSKNCVDSIPYKDIYPNGIIEVEEGLYSKCYELPTANFRSVSDDKQKILAESYSELLSSIGSDAMIQITLVNKTIDINKFQEDVLLKMKPDGLNEYREEYNKMLLDKMLGAKNNLETVPYLTINIEAESILEVVERFSIIDKIVDEHVAAITKQPAKPLGLLERLDLLNNIYNQDNSMPLYQKQVIHVNGEEKEIESFSLENCIRQGITTKDLIAPSCMEVKSDYLRIGENYAKCFSITNFPSWIKAKILTDFGKIPTNMVTSVFFNPYSQEESIKMIKDQNRNIATKLLDDQKKAYSGGFDASLVSPETQDAKVEAEELLDGVTKDNSTLFDVTFAITIFAPDLKTLNIYEKELKSICVGNLVHLKPMSMQQLQAFDTSLPLGKNYLPVTRLMTSASVASIIPFNVKDIKSSDGKYCGQHGISHTMIIYDKFDDLNPNSAILGMTGAGKSFSCKLEMLSTILGSDDELYVIDPDNEYEVLVEAFGGAYIHLATGSNIHINMFDLNLENKEKDKDPVKIKIDFITAVMEIMIGGKYGLSPIEESIIGRCTQLIYEPYLEYLNKNNLTFEQDKCPTLEDFYECLEEQPQIEAANLALSLEKYVKGAADIFAHKTNIQISNRFTVYGIRDIGGLKSAGLQICLDNIFNKMIENSKLGKRTYIYIDEFHLLMDKKFSADYIEQIWKRCRKYHTSACCITQNVEDLLKSTQARAVLNNCSFIKMLGQSEMNRIQLREMYDISKAEEKFISSANPGSGLLRIGEVLVPVVDKFPSNTKLYKLMDTSAKRKD